VLGAGILWFGWFGFNAGSAGAANDIAVRSFMVTNTSAAAGMLSWMLIEKLTSGKSTLVGAATGFVLGLASITQSAGYISVPSAIAIGAISSPICYFFITWVKPKLGYDDALDAFGCHGIGGIWGCIAAGIFSNTALNPAVRWNGLIYGDLTLFLRQLEAIAVTVIISIAGTIIAIGIVKLVTGQLRVTDKSESMGLDVSEHGEIAYPAFNGMDNLRG
jgi:Amt family ammonium transporter